jgi:inosose dehydratase
MQVSLSMAPGTWGVESPRDPANPPWPAVLSEIAEIGFDGIELGPLGYLPENRALLRSELASRSLSLVAGFVMEPFHEPSRRAAIRDVAERTCALLDDMGAAHLVLIEAIVPARALHAGRFDDAPRLEDARWRLMLGAIDEVALLAAEHGLEATFHPHAGTYVEFADEVARLVAELDGAVGLCLDTGHCAYSGIDPVALFRAHSARVRYLHFKDARNDVLARCHEDGLGFADAVAAGVFCPLGRGNVDFVGFRDVLADSDYQGWATVEQDRLPGAGDPRADAQASLDHLRRVGIGFPSPVVEGGAT